MRSGLEGFDQSKERIPLVICGDDSLWVRWVDSNETFFCPEMDTVGYGESFCRKLFSKLTLWEREIFVGISFLSFPIHRLSVEILEDLILLSLVLASSICFTMMRSLMKT